VSFGLQRIEPPKSSAISRSLVETFLRSIPEDSEHVTQLIAASANEVERLTGRALIRSRYRQTQAGFPTAVQASNRFMFPADARSIQLAREPLVSVESVKGYVSGTLTTLSGYYVIADRGLVVFDTAYTFPELDERPDALQVEFTAGYGLTASDVPAELHQAMLLLCRYNYAGGNANVNSSNHTDKDSAHSILEGWRASGWTA
jgi:uncharacterized phiE125 gp8 family phage protein